MLNAKSIGWPPTKARFADVKEAAKNNWREGTLVVEEWLVIKYAVGTISVNPQTVVEVVSKTIKPDDDRRPWLREPRVYLRCPYAGFKPVEGR